MAMPRVNICVNQSLAWASSLSANHSGVLPISGS
jgi:hypothetical protein